MNRTSSQGINRSVRIFILCLLTGFLSPSISLAQSGLLDGLIAYYPLDGDALDKSGHCNHGVVHGATATHGLSGDFLSGMAFDGVDDYIEIPHTSQFDFSSEQDLAISFWVRIAENQMDTDTSDNDIISKWVIDDTRMKHEREGYPFTFRVINQKRKQRHHLYAAQFGGYSLSCRGATSLQTRVQPSDSEYQHILLNVKSGKFYLYIDGQLKRRKGSNVFCSAKNKAPLRLGKRGGSAFQNYFTGAIDELAIYNRALTDEEIALFSNKEFTLSELINFSVNTSLKIQSDTIFFDDDVYQLNSGQRIKINELVKYLSIGNQYHLIIHGHTNGLPSDDFSDVLSLKRAKVVEQYLFDIGISCHKITTKAHGKRQQISPNSTPILRKKNQRVEIELYQITKA